MAGNARYTAVLDACVLYSSAIVDSLMSIAVTGIYAAKWTEKIEEEWINSLEKNRPDLVGKLTTRRDAMREAVPDWEIQKDAWNSIINSIKLPDENDRHVLAAAIVGHADCIVTKNQKDFPSDILDRYGIDVLDPDEFIINQWDLESVIVMTAFKNMRARRKKPTESVEDFARALEKNGLPLTAQKIREAATLI
jgi:predicted nucleic acid-binding protein